MKQGLKLLLPLITGIIIFSGCERCINCEYTYTDPETKKKEIFQYDKVCGTSEDIDEFKEDAKADAREVDGDLTCTEEDKWFFD